MTKHDIGAFKKAEAYGTRDRISVWQQAHPWGTQVECAKALDLSVMTVNRHVNAIRAEWRSAIEASAESA